MSGDERGRKGEGVGGKARKGKERAIIHTKIYASCRAWGF